MFRAPVDSRALIAFRALYCSWLAVSVAAAWGLAFDPSRYDPIRLFSSLGVGPWIAGLLPVLHAVLLLSLVCAAAGFLARPALWVSAAAYFLYWGTRHSLTKPPLADTAGNSTELAFFVLLLLAAAPDPGRWDRPRAVSGWPLQGVKLMLGLAYLGAALGKWFVTGPAWIDGTALSSFLLQNAMLRAEGLNLWLANQPAVCAALSAFTLLFESLFLLVLVFPRTGAFFALSGLALHAGIRIVMGIDYFPFFAPAYLAFLPWPWRTTGTAEPDGLTALRVVAVLQLTFIISGAQAWPLSPYRFYTGRPDPATLVGYRLKAGETWVHLRGKPDPAWAENARLVRAMSGEPSRAWLRRERERLGAVVVKRTAVRDAGGWRFVDEAVGDEHVPAALAPGWPR